MYAAARMQRASRWVIPSVIFALIIIVGVRVWVGNLGVDGLNIGMFYPDTTGISVMPERLIKSLGPVNENDRIVQINGQPLAFWADKLFASPLAFPSGEQTAYALEYKIQNVKDGTERNVSVAILPISGILDNFDLAGRWSNPLMAVFFLAIGLWIYFLRPYESTAIGLLTLGVSTFLYQLFQPFFRQVSDLTQPFVFWYDAAIAMIAGTTIFGALMHIALVFPRSIAGAIRIKNKRFATWQLILVGYLLPQILFWSLQAGVFFAEGTPAQKLLHFQQNWQFTQTVGYSSAAIMGVFHWVAANNPKDRKDLGMVVITSAGISLFIIFAEKIFLLTNQPPLFDANLRRFASVVFPLAMAFQILSRKIFRINKFIDWAAVNGLVFAIICIFQLAFFWALARALSFSVEPVLVIVMAAFSLLISIPLERALNRPITQILNGRQPGPPQLIEAIEQSFDLRLPAEASIKNATDAIAKTLRVKQTEIEISDGANKPPKPDPLDNLTTVIPLRFQSQELGRLVITFAPDRMFDLSQELRETISHELGALLYAARISANLRMAQKKALSIEKTQQNLRRQLHDGLGAEMGGMVLSIDATRRLIGSGKLSDADGVLDMIKTASVKMVEEVRSIARMDQGLIPTELAQLGLKNSLESFLRPFTQRLEIVLEINLLADRLPAEIEAALYYTVREAVNNVVKHANATRCVIQINALAGEKVVLSIADNGSGLGIGENSGAGIKSMRQRVMDLGGVLTISQNQPCGAIIRAELPTIDSGSEEER